MGQIVLTGSQNFLLMERVTQSLAGRVGYLNLLDARGLKASNFEHTRWN